MKKIFLITPIIFQFCTSSISTNIQKDSVDNLPAIKKVATKMLLSFKMLKDSCSNHTSCDEINGDECFLPANINLKKIFKKL